jgi:type IV secretory pathway VirB2 component (pilin)
MRNKLSLNVPKSSMHQARRLLHVGIIVVPLVLLPIVAQAQSGSPFDTGFTAIQTLFTGIIAKVASLVAIVIGGYGFAHGEPGAKKAPRQPTGTGTLGLLSRRLERIERPQSQAHSASCAELAVLD